MKPNHLEDLKLQNIGNIVYNPNYDKLIEDTLANGEVNRTSLGATAVDTGIFTGRSPKDKYFVKQNPSQKHIAWGEINQPISKEIFEHLLDISRKELSNSDLYIIDLFTGVGKSRRAIRFVTKTAWQAHFVTNMFIVPTKEELANFKPDFTFYVASGVKNDKWKEQGLNSEVFIAFNIEENIAVMGGTLYGGEMKKGIFTMMNYWLPLEGKLSMHCSANIGEEGDTAVFFGLSGTGKTYLAQALLKKRPAVYIASDIVRKKLLNLDPTKHYYAEFEKGIYTPEITEKTYKKMAELAREELTYGRDVILDATFKEKVYRQWIIEGLKGVKAKIYWIWCQAEDEVVKERIFKRKEEDSYSDALRDIYLSQKKKFEEPTECEPLLILNTSESSVILVDQVLKFLKN